MSKRRNRVPKLAWLVLIAGVLATHACTAPAPGIPFFVEWADRMDVMGYVAVMPPNEDVRVGDIYVFDVGPITAKSSGDRSAASRRIATTGRWAALPVLDELEAEYQQRRAWPMTPNAFVEARRDPGSRQIWQEPVASEGGSLFSIEPAPTRLRHLGLDGFTAVSFSTGDLEAVIPTEVAPIVGGEVRPETVSITMRVGSAESYSLSQAETIRLLTEQASGEEGETLYRVRQPYRDNLDFVASDSGRVWLHVITEVVCIRSADMAIRPIRETPKDDEVTLEELAVMSRALPSAQTQPPAGEEAAAADRPGLRAYAATKLDPIYGAFLRAKAINEVLVESNVSDSPGGLVRFLSVTDESVALRRVWPRGLAIGVRGLSLEVDAATGEVLKSGPLP